MKRFVVFVGLIGFLVTAYFVHSYLKESVEDQVTIEWANSLVWAAIGSQSSVKFLEPKVAADAQPDHWIVTGEIALRQGATAALTVHPYTARLARLCEAADRRECWRLDELVIGGSEVDLTGLESDDRRTEGQTASGAPAPDARVATTDSGGGAVPAPPDGEASGAMATGRDPMQTSGEATVDGTAPSSDSAANEVATLTGAAAPEAASATPTQTATAASSDAEAAASQYSSERRQMIAEIQARLLDLGYDPGPVDGLMGPQTRAAIENYQRKNDFTVNGEPSAQLLQFLERQE